MKQEWIDYALSRLEQTESGCWLWPGGTDGGYGVFIRQGRRVSVHRLIYESVKGMVPEGLVLHHTCRNRRCANPDHLQPVDHRSNVLLGNGCFAQCARATHCPRGHEYSGDNLYIRSGRYRGCRACDRIRKAAAKERKKERERTGEPAPKRVAQPRSPGKSSGNKNTIQDILLRLVLHENGCWEWPGRKTHKGYAVAKCEGRSQPVHRIVYEHFVAPIPEGLVIDHLCRNRACCNFEHLEPVTNRENILRGEGIAAQQVKRTHCPHGHPYQGKNLFINKKGSRMCRMCMTRRTVEHQKRKRQSS